MLTHIDIFVFYIIAVWYYHCLFKYQFYIFLAWSQPITCYVNIDINIMMQQTYYEKPVDIFKSVSETYTKEDYCKLICRSTQ